MKDELSHTIASPFLFICLCKVRYHRFGGRLHVKMTATKIRYVSKESHNTALQTSTLPSEATKLHMFFMLYLSLGFNTTDHTQVYVSITPTLLNQVHAGLWPVHTWFLKLFCTDIHMCVCVCVCMFACVCVSSPETINTSDIIWTPYDWLNKIYSRCMATAAIIVNGCGLGINIRHGN